MPTKSRVPPTAADSVNAMDVTTAAALSGSATLTIANNVFPGATAEGLE